MNLLFASRLLVVAAVAYASFSGADAEPNVVFILADDLGWADSEPYGSRFHQTPQLNRLADQGMRFTNAYVANPLCSPTRASILTGQYPARLRFTTPGGHLPQPVLDATIPAEGPPNQPATHAQSNTRLPNEVLTLGELFRDAGYRTAFMGKWHLGTAPHIPENQGFDAVVGGRHHPGPPPPGHFFSPWDIDTIPPRRAGAHIDDALTDEAIGFIETARQENKPFFLCLWYYGVHAPFQGKPELIEKYAEMIDPDDPQQTPVMGAMIETLDTNVGRMLDRLEVLGLADDTVVIFYSDNGGNMYDRVDGRTPTSNHPLRGGKAMSYEGGVRVPLIVRWPSVTLAGTTTDAVVSSVDFFPTLVDGLALDVEEDVILDGVSLMPALRRQAFDRGPIFCHFPHYIGNPQVEGWLNIPSTTVRSGSWKLHRFYADGPNQTDRFELYHLSDDVGETNDLAAEHPDLVVRLTGLIDEHLADTSALRPRANPRYIADWKPLVTQADPVGGWKASGNGQAALSLREEMLIVKSIGEDPWIETTDVPRVGGELTLTLAMRSDSSGQAEVFWSEEGDPGFEPGRRSMAFTPVHDGRWHEYRIVIGAETPLTALRIDPCRAAGEVCIDWIRLEQTGGDSFRVWAFDVEFSAE